MVDVFVVNINWSYHPAMAAEYSTSGIEALTEMRREAGRNTQYWSELRKQVRDSNFGKYIKEQLKAAMRIEKSTTIWINYFTVVELRNVSHFPKELSTELNLAWNVYDLNR